MPGGYHALARMTIISSGTTTFALGTAAASFNTFANAGAIDGEIVPYGAIDTQGNSEGGWGTYNSAGSSTSGPSLTRNPLASTNGGALVNFASSTTQVYIDVGVPDLVQLSLTAQAHLGGL